MTHKVILNIEGVSQWFGNNRVLHDVNLKIVQGQFVALVGSSGCGKSTLLKAILGTQPPKEGIVETDGMPITGPNRNVGIVYQRYGLYRFATTEQNVAFGLKIDQTQIRHRTFMPWYWWPLRKKHLQQSREFLAKLHMDHCLDKYPAELSGGMQQRVALAQAMIMRPKVLLLDEPFGALDEATREDCQMLLLNLYQENLAALRAGQPPPWTVIIITHELNEAFYVSDRVVALGRHWHQYLPNGKTVNINGVPIGGRLTGESCGATKVWDKAAPTYRPDEPKDFSKFAAMRDELKRFVLSGQECPERETHVSFWHDLERGVGTGVAFLKGPNDE
jgi:NitT/TauT family transport system ATP-binding protein